jgi:hypothetical protein
VAAPSLNFTRTKKPGAAMVCDGPGKARPMSRYHNQAWRINAERLRKLEALAERPGTPGEGRAARVAIARVLGARLAKPPYQIGERVYAGHTKYPPCRHCGSHLFKVEAGVEPHAAQLKCADCGRFNKWLRRSLIATAAT